MLQLGLLRRSRSSKVNPLDDLRKILPGRQQMVVVPNQGLKNGFFVSVRTSATGKRTSAECEMDKKYSVRITVNSLHNIIFVEYLRFVRNSTFLLYKETETELLKNVK